MQKHVKHWIRQNSKRSKRTKKKIDPTRRSNATPSTKLTKKRSRLELDSGIDCFGETNANYCTLLILQFKIQEHQLFEYSTGALNWGQWSQSHAETKKSVSNIPHFAHIWIQMRTIYIRIAIKTTAAEETKKKCSLTHKSKKKKIMIHFHLLNKHFESQLNGMTSISRKLKTYFIRF